MTASAAPDGDELDDLRRVLGYSDAAADGELRVVGDEMVAMPFWTPAFCAAVVRAAEAVGAFGAHDDDPVPSHDCSLALISPRLFEAVQDDLGVRIWPSLRAVWPAIDYHGLRDAFVIRYALGEQEHLRLHHDIAQLSASVKLNDGYDGACLEFPRQGTDNSSLAIGELLAWPSLVTHPHRTTQLRAGTKYALTIWFELPAVY
jgi:hypothetical protein